MTCPILPLPRSGLASSFASAEEGLSTSQSARNRRASGLEADIAWRALENVVDAVPRFSRRRGPAAEVVLA